ncbi:MAG: hypothetical protein AAGC60_28610, partial [Acidobacteriota bacterium]
MEPLVDGPDLQTANGVTTVREKVPLTLRLPGRSSCPHERVEALRLRDCPAVASLGRRIMCHQY